MYYEDKHLFTDYDNEEYRELLRDKKNNNCIECANYKAGACILLKINVSVLYICPNFKRKGNENG